MYTNLKGRVNWGRVLSDTFAVTTGVRQGGVYSVSTLAWPDIWRTRCGSRDVRTVYSTKILTCKEAKSVARRFKTRYVSELPIRVRSGFSLRPYSVAQRHTTFDCIDISR